MPSIEELERICSQCRRDIVRMTHDAKSGHPGGSLGCTEYMVALYFQLLEHDPSNFDMNGLGKDLFFLSNGHISPIWYSVLARNGYFSVEELKTFRKMDSRLQGHPATEEGLPGIRVASGSLGQGLSVAIGASISKRLNGDKRIIYSLHGDGELQEGQIWEAAMYGGSKGVDGLISTIDYNGRQIDGDVNAINDLGDLRSKWESFGWEVLEMDGNVMQEVIETLEQARSRCRNGHPIMIIMHTEMGKGVDFMMGSHEWHGVPPNDEQLENALGQLEETLGDY
ncbi:MAG: transketolase [Flavobacteriales bacterium]